MESLAQPDGAMEIVKVATLLRQTESVPAKYPVVAGLALSREMLWQRIEPYIAYRWSTRNIAWVVEGPGEWVPPLTPATISTVVVWSRGASEWEAATLSPSPLGGYQLPCTGPYLFTGTVGVDDSIVPAAVQEALHRLDAYLSQPPGKAGATVESMMLGGDLVQRIERDAGHMAKALQNSGAADLLRAFRKV
jgi:hypothetical protein